MNNLKNQSNTINKGGRPRKWFLPLVRMNLPAKYADALLEIALEWQENESLNED